MAHRAVLPHEAKTAAVGNCLAGHAILEARPDEGAVLGVHLADHVLGASGYQLLQAVAGHGRRGLVGEDDDAVLEDHQPLPRVEHQVAIRLLGAHPVGDIAVAGAPAQPAAIRPMHGLADVVDPAFLAGAGDDAELQGQWLGVVKLVLQVVGEDEFRQMVID